MKKNLLKKMRPSGLIVGIVIGAAAAFAVQNITFSKKMSASLLPGPNATVCQLTEMPASSSLNGIIATQPEFNDAVSSYQQSHPNTDPNVTWGGMIGKNHLIAIINSLGPNATEVNFKFITNLNNGKTSIFFKGGNFNAVSGEPSPTNLYIRTGTANDAFCPTRCN